MDKDGPDMLFDRFNKELAELRDMISIWLFILSNL